MAATSSSETVAEVPTDWWTSFVPPPGARAEIIQGALTLSPSLSPAHGLVQTQLLTALKATMPTGLAALINIEWLLAKGGIVAIAPQPDLMIGEWDPRNSTIALPPLLAAEILTPTDTAPWEGITRIEGKRLDYALNGLRHYLEINPDMPAVTRYELRDGHLEPVDQAAGDATLTAGEPFPYTLQPAALLRP